MTKLDFDELNSLVEASLQVEDLEGTISTIRNLLRGAYQQAVLDMEEEFEFIFMYYPEMLDQALEKTTRGLTWEERVRSWYKGENPNEEYTLPSDTDKGETTLTKSEGENTPSRQGTPPVGGEPTPSGQPPTKGKTTLPNIEAIKRVVETEANRMHNAGAFDTAKAYAAEGHTVYKRWVTMMDEKVRSTHLYLEGESVPLDEEFFTFDGDSALYPGGFSLPNNNINCRCDLEYESI